jgi:hypothetical protein
VSDMVKMKGKNRGWRYFRGQISGVGGFRGNVGTRQVFYAE